MFDKAFLGGKVYRGLSVFQPLNLYTRGGKIAALTDQVLEASEIIDCKGLYILPGLIDPHVHFDLDLGPIKTCDNFETGSAQAAMGGITTVLDFLDPIVETEALALANQRRGALAESQKPFVDYGFHATLGDFKGDIPTLVEAVDQLKLFGVKVFTTYRESHRMIDFAQLEVLLDQEVLTLVHAEHNGFVTPLWRDIASYGESRPLIAELKMLEWLKSHLGRGSLYVVHVSSGSGVAVLAENHAHSKDKGANKSRIWIESCPHYFYFDEQVLARPEGALFLIAPPLRSAQEVQRLCNHFHAIHAIGTDHCAFDHKLKLQASDASEVPKGIGGIAHSFLLMYRQFGALAIDKMSSNVAEIFGLSHKGRLAEGYDADLVLFDPSGTTALHGDIGVRHKDIYQMAPVDLVPQVLEGALIGTMLRGDWVVYKGNWYRPRGQLLHKDK